jgi:hypothetical protein
MLGAGSCSRGRVVPMTRILAAIRAWWRALWHPKPEDDVDWTGGWW